MYGNLGDGLEKMFWFILCLLCIFIPLGIWKLVDVAIWIMNNVSIKVG